MSFTNQEPLQTDVEMSKNEILKLARQMGGDYLESQATPSSKKESS